VILKLFLIIIIIIIIIITFFVVVLYDSVGCLIVIPLMVKR
jgi:hypothetical protein